MNSDTPHQANHVWVVAFGNLLGLLDVLNEALFLLVAGCGYRMTMHSSKGVRGTLRAVASFSLTFYLLVAIIIF